MRRWHHTGAEWKKKKPMNRLKGLQQFMLLRI
jgi:hypothetical protein